MGVGTFSRGGDMHDDVMNYEVTNIISLNARNEYCFASLSGSRPTFSFFRPLSIGK